MPASSLAYHLVFLNFLPVILNLRPSDQNILPAVLNIMPSDLNLMPFNLNGTPSDQNPLHSVLYRTPSDLNLMPAVLNGVHGILNLSPAGLDGYRRRASKDRGLPSAQETWMGDVGEACAASPIKTEIVEFSIMSVDWTAIAGILREVLDKSLQNIHYTR